ncbi:DUF5320 family protein [Desulforhopalus vacuolatus]|uniref:DUF5320 family protein n=1 Tax=Desulforhopalus vacuolatus TaxID=40414 RepID=UPI0034E0207E
MPGRNGTGPQGRGAGTGGGSGICGAPKGSSSQCRQGGGTGSSRKKVEERAAVVNTATAGICSKNKL